MDDIKLMLQELNDAAKHIGLQLNYTKAKIMNYYRTTGRMSINGNYRMSKIFLDSVRKIHRYYLEITLFP